MDTMNTTGGDDAEPDTEPCTDPDARPDADPDDGPDAELTRRERWWDLMAAVILSLATLFSAWSSYQAARWNGDITASNRAATTARFNATKQTNLANRHVLIDTTSFAAWLEAEVTGQDEVATALVERFRPELKVAFDAWLSDGSGNLPAGTPLEHPDYVLAANEETNRFLTSAERHSDEADTAVGNSDRFVLTAVLYASVLFFAGLASKLNTPSGRHLAVILAGAMFVVATGVVLSLPMT